MSLSQSAHDSLILPHEVPTPLLSWSSCAYVLLLFLPFLECPLFLFPHAHIYQFFKALLKCQYSLCSHPSDKNKPFSFKQCDTSAYVCCSCILLVSNPYCRSTQQGLPVPLAQPVLLRIWAHRQDGLLRAGPRARVTLHDQASPSIYPPSGNRVLQGVLFAFNSNPWGWNLLREFFPIVWFLENCPSACHGGKEGMCAYFKNVKYKNEVSQVVFFYLILN